MGLERSDDTCFNYKLLSGSVSKAHWIRLYQELRTLERSVTTSVLYGSPPSIVAASNEALWLYLYVIKSNIYYNYLHNSE